MDFPDIRMPAPPILTAYSPECLGAMVVAQSLTLDGSASTAWSVANQAFFYPFRLTDWATAYQLLFFVGGVSSGNIDMGIYDSQANAIVRMGSTAMSATIDTVQELNITNTVLPPGDYFLAAACDNTTGTCFAISPTDEGSLANTAVYQQAGLTAAALTDPAVPVVATTATIPIYAVGIQLRSVF